MSLWVDKYRPTTLSRLDHHKDQAEKLKKIVSGNDFPHLLVYGPPGAGKKTRVMCILHELYGSGVERLRIDHKNFEAPSGKRLEIASVSSNYHVEINPGDVGIYDRVVVQEIIKTMAQTQQLESAAQRDFKVVVLTEVDRLTKDAQHALRRTMEKYMSTCRLILCCKSTSKVIGPLRSRCLAVRVAAPSNEEVIAVLNGVCKRENVNLSPKLAEKIAVKAEGNLRRALLMCEACRVAMLPSPHMTDTQDVAEPDWEIYLRDTASLIIKQQTPEGLLKVRERLYEMLTRCIPPTVIFQRLLLELISSCDADLKPQITSVAADFEHRMQLGSKAIYHLEAFIAKFMTIYKRFLEDTSTMMDFA